MTSNQRTINRLTLCVQSEINSFVVVAVAIVDTYVCECDARATSISVIDDDDHGNDV